MISVPILGFYNGLAQWMRWFRWSVQIMDTIRRSTPHSRDRDVGHRMVKRRNPGSGQGSNDQSPGLLRLVSASLSGGHVGDTADSFSHLCHTGTVTL